MTAPTTSNPLLHSPDILKDDDIAIEFIYIVQFNCLP